MDVTAPSTTCCISWVHKNPVAIGTFVLLTLAVIAVLLKRYTGSNVIASCVPIGIFAVGVAAIALADAYKFKMEQRKKDREKVFAIAPEINCNGASGYELFFGVIVVPPSLETKDIEAYLARHTMSPAQDEYIYVRHRHRLEMIYPGAWGKMQHVVINKQRGEPLILVDVGALKEKLKKELGVEHNRVMRQRVYRGVEYVD